MERNRPIAISACISVMIIIGFTTHSWLACVVGAIALTVASYCWYKTGIKRPWAAKEIRQKHTYIYYGCADHKKINFERLICGELRIKFAQYDNGYIDVAELERQYREGMFRIDVKTDELIPGSEYYGEIMMQDEKPVTTLRKIRT
jgi:hypothetical protein